MYRLENLYRKRFYVRIDLQLHAITCPGVWLCKHGGVQCTIKALGYFFRTGWMEPRFPILCHDEFTMEGYYKTAHSLDELEHMLAAEQLDITLWQNGRRLAYFQGTLVDIMKPTLPKLSCEHNVNAQLLMKATAAFPGIIAPKVELTAEVNVQDRLMSRLGSADSYSGRHYSLDKLQPKRLVLEPTQFSKFRKQKHCCCDLPCCNRRQERRKQQPVCHAKRPCKCLLDCCSRPASSTNSFEADFVAHDNAQRRLSNCSSIFSNFSNTNSHYSDFSNSTDCCHTLKSNADANTATTSISTDEQPSCCTICQEYQRVFLQVPH